MINILFIAGGIAVTVFIFYIRHLILFIRIPAKLERAKKFIETDEKRSIEMLNAILNIDRGNPEANWILAHYHLKKKWYILALMYLHDIIKYGRYNSKITEIEVREILADAYEKSGSLDKALQQYYEIKKKRPFTPAMYKKIIRLQTATGSLQEAGKTITEAAHAYIQDGEFNYLAAAIEYEQHNFSAAETHLKDAERKGYLSPECDILLGKVYFTLQNFEAAIECFQKLPQEYLGSEEIENFLGQAFYQIKDYSHASELLEKIVSRMNPGDQHIAEAQYFLGCAHEMNGNFDRAIEVWKNIPSFPPDLYLSAKEKIEFYTQIATGSAEKVFISESFAGFSTACEALLSQMEYTLKSKEYQDEKNTEYICTFKRDNYVFNLYYFSFTRQTTPVNEHFLKEKNFRRIAGRARYLTVVAPWFTEGAHEYAKANEIQLYTLDIFRKHGLIG